VSLVVETQLVNLGCVAVACAGAIYEDQQEYAKALEVRLIAAVLHEKRHKEYKEPGSKQIAIEHWRGLAQSSKSVHVACAEWMTDYHGVCAVVMGFQAATQKQTMLCLEKLLKLVSESLML
jgi:hypothetical protein